MLRLGQNGIGDIFKFIFFNENFRISKEIALKYVPVCLVDGKSALVQVNGLVP